MLFIPQEVKDKMAELEAENEQLKAEAQRLHEEALRPEAPNGSKTTVWMLVIALLLALAAIVYLLFFHQNPATMPVEDAQAVMMRDGKIEKWNRPQDSTVVFRVQLGAYQNFDLNRYRQNLEGLQQDSIDGFHKISLGAFSRITDAQNFQSEMEKLGFQNVYIVAYENNRPIGLIEAAKKQK